MKSSCRQMEQTLRWSLELVPLHRTRCRAWCWEALLVCWLLIERKCPNLGRCFHFTLIATLFKRTNKQDDVPQVIVIVAIHHKWATVYATTEHTEILDVGVQRGLLAERAVQKELSDGESRENFQMSCRAFRKFYMSLIKLAILPFWLMCLCVSDVIPGVHRGAGLRSRRGSQVAGSGREGGTRQWGEGGALPCHALSHGEAGGSEGLLGF